MKIGKTIISDNDLSQREPEQMTLSDSFVLVLRDKGEFDLKLSNRAFRIAQAFVPKVELWSEETSWKNVISEKANSFQHCETEV